MALTCPDFDPLFRRFHQDIYRLCFLLAPGSQAAYQCTFKTFLQIGPRQEPFPTLEAGRDALLGHALSVCEDYYLRKLRRRPSREALDKLFPAPLGDGLWALFRLPLKKRAAFYLLRCMALTPEEAAGVLGVSPARALRLAEAGASQAAEELLALSLPEGQADILLDEIYLRFSERNVGLENRLLAIRAAWDRLVPWLALGLLLIGAAAAWYTTTL